LFKAKVTQEFQKLDDELKNLKEIIKELEKVSESNLEERIAWIVNELNNISSNQVTT
jgi:predicted nuclease with TOPRIM domain